MNYIILLINFMKIHYNEELLELQHFLNLRKLLENDICTRHHNINCKTLHLLSTFKIIQYTFGQLL